MTVWISGDIRLDKPFTFQDPVKTVVIAGELTSDFDITLEAKNLIIFGKIITTQDLTLKTQIDLFNSGTLNARNLRIVSENSVCNGLDDQAIEKIRALGIDLIKTSNGGLSFRMPESS